MLFALCSLAPPAATCKQLLSKYCVLAWPWGWAMQSQTKPERIISRKTEVWLYQIQVAHPCPYLHVWPILDCIAMCSSSFRFGFEGRFDPSSFSPLPWGFFDALRIRGLWGFRKHHDSWQKVLLSLADPGCKWVMNLMFGLIPPDACGIQFYQHVPGMMQSCWCVIKDWPKCRFSCWSIGDPFCNRLVPISSIRLQISESLKLGLLL